MLMISDKVHNWTVVEDLTSDVFFKALRGWDNYHEQDKILPWLRMIARNTVIDYVRSARPTEELEDIHVSPAGELQDIEDEMWQAGLLDVLKPAHRTILLMTVNGWSADEIGNAVNLNGNAVRQARFRALAKLKKELAA